MSSLNCQGCDWFAKSWEAGAKRNCKKMGPSLIVFWPEQWNQHKPTHAKCSKHFGTFGSPCKLPWPQNIAPASQVPNPFVFNLFAPLARGCLNMKHRNIWNYRMITFMTQPPSHCESWTTVRGRRLAGVCSTLPLLQCWDWKLEFSSVCWRLSGDFQFSSHLSKIVSLGHPDSMSISIKRSVQPNSPWLPYYYCKIKATKSRKST